MFALIQHTESHNCLQNELNDTNTLEWRLLHEHLVKVKMYKKEKKKNNVHS